MHIPENFEYLNQYFRLSKDFNLGKDYHKVLERPEFYLDKWLIKPNLTKDYSKDVNEARELMRDLYDGNFYEDLPPTNFANSLSLVGKNTLVKKITVVSRTLPNKTGLDESKVNFINNLFNGINDKVEILLLEGKHEKKSDVIKMLGNDIGFIYEDETSNIIDIVRNCDNLDRVNLMIPSYGYNNDIPQEIMKEAKDKNINIKYYFDR